VISIRAGLTRFSSWANGNALGFTTKLPVNQWSFMAATPDFKTQIRRLYLNGLPVAKSE